MDPILASCRLALELLRDLIAAVTSRDAELVARPPFARKCVAVRLKAGLRLIAAYLRRVLIELALQIEPTLKPDLREDLGPLRRRKTCRRRIRIVRQLPVFHILAKPYRPVTDKATEAWRQSRVARRWRARPAPRPVPMRRLYGQLEQLMAIAKDPLPRARRLAWWLARHWEGPIIAPDLYLRIPGRWGSEVSMMFDAMGYGILERSRNRPPLLPPPPRRGPSVSLL